MTASSIRTLSVCIVLAVCVASSMSAPASAMRGLSILSRRAHEFDHYFESSAAKPNDTRVVTGVVEVLAAVPMAAATANGSAKFVEHDASSPHMNPLRLRKYLLHADGVTHALTFDNFEDSVPPVYLATGNLVSVDAVLSAPGPHPFHGLESFAIGVQAGEAHVHSRLSTSSKYSVGGTTSLSALFVLIDFADAPNSCQASAPSGVSGKDFLNSLIFTGNYHSGKSVAGLYNTESNGRFQLVSSGSRIAGPYTMSQFNTGQDCNANYASWVSAAKAAATKDGYNMANYGTIVVISPTPKGCFWGGLATLSGACQPGVTTYNPPLCFSSFLMCVPFVVAHELGHNIGLEHSGTDSSNSAPSTSNVYGDWGCTMGNRNGWNRVNAHKAYVMGWLAQSRVVELNAKSASATYTLTPLDTPDSQSSGPTLITFLDKSTSPTKTYFFASRATSGYADSLPSPYNGGVNIHYKTSDNQYSWFVQSIPAGGSFTAPVSGYKFTVSTFQSGSGAATLQVTSPGGSAPPPPPPSSTDSYSWQTGSWSGCSVNCGTGTQTRSVTCVGSISGPVSSSLCVNAGTAPSTSQSCTVSNCVSYSWTASNWGTCSVSCGSGTQTRSVTCTSSTGAVVSNSYCSGSMATSQSCYAGTCSSYSWSTGSWSACSSTCGTGTQSRSVSCVDQNGATSSSSSLCTSTQPATSQSCSSGSSCASYSWYTGGWSACSSTCGSGSQTRTVSCLGSNGYTYSDYYCSAAGTKPSASQSCSGPTCTSYSWSTGAWSACSATCGTGAQTRSVTCVSSGGAAQVDSYCSGAGTKPSTSQSCSGSTACSSYSWYTGPYGACSVTCGTGTQSRSVYCRDQYGYAVSDTSCSSAGTKPSTQTSCSAGTCPSSGGSSSSSSYSNYWAVGAWGTCVVSCPFGGTQTRVVVCVTPYGYIADASTCNPATKPATSQVCASYSCFAAINSTSTDDESSSSASSSASSDSDAREPVTYSWSTSVFSACSASCGQGTQTRSVVCTDSLGNTVSDSSCSDEAPASTRPCSGPKCSAHSPSASSSDEGDWRPYSWSECSAECGGGRQHRSVQCVSSTTGRWLPSSACSDDSTPRPSATQSCNEQPCGNKFDSICYPEYCGSHGKCQVEYGKMYCVCQEGFSGATCRVAPSISSVNVTKGPSGLVVTWQHTSASNAQVGIYLVPTATNISQVAMRQTENTGSAILPSSVTNGLVGTFVVEVVASALARSASAPFNLFACESDSDCSGHGSCSNYECDCTDGYSGATCRVPAPAPSSACRPGQCLNGGACLNQNGKAVCDCSSSKGFSGARCQVPPACSGKSSSAVPQCQNGGVPSSSCKQCACSGHWKGAECTQCALNCSGHGKPSADCSTCICDSDRAGSACDQQFRAVTVGPFFFNSAGLSAAENVTFNQQLLSDIAVGFGLSPSSLSVESLRRDASTGGVFVTLRVLSSSSSSSSDSASQSSELDELLAVLQRSMGSSNSTFYRAAISSRLSFDDRSMIVVAPDSDPSTPSSDPNANPADSGSSGSSGSFIPAVVGSVTGGVALVAAIAAAVIIRRRRSASASASSGSADAEDARSNAGAKPYESEPVMMSRSPSPGISRSPSPGGEAAGGFIPDQDVREISISEVDTV